MNRITTVLADKFLKTKSDLSVPPDEHVASSQLVSTLEIFIHTVVARIAYYTNNTVIGKNYMYMLQFNIVYTCTIYIAHGMYMYMYTCMYMYTMSKP